MVSRRAATWQETPPRVWGGQRLAVSTVRLVGNTPTRVGRTQEDYWIFVPDTSAVLFQNELKTGNFRQAASRVSFAVNSVPGSRGNTLKYQQTTFGRTAFQKIVDDVPGHGILDAGDEDVGPWFYEPELHSAANGRRQIIGDNDEQFFLL